MKFQQGIFGIYRSGRGGRVGFIYPRKQQGRCEGDVGGHTPLEKDLSANLIGKSKGFWEALQLVDTDFSLS